jgi:hypothetical protein
MGGVIKALMMIVIVGWMGILVVVGSNDNLSSTH